MSKESMSLSIKSSALKRSKKPCVEEGHTRVGKKNEIPWSVFSTSASDQGILPVIIGWAVHRLENLYYRHPARIIMDPQVASLLQTDGLIVLYDPKIYDSLTKLFCLYIRLGGPQTREPLL